MKASKAATAKARARRKAIREARLLLGVACQRCGGPGEQVHHRKLRSQGGSDALANLALLCDRCHSHVHANPAESYAAGWLIRSSGICDLCGLETGMRFVGSNGYCAGCASERFGA